MGDSIRQPEVDTASALRAERYATDRSGFAATGTSEARTRRRRRFRQWQEDFWGERASLWLFGLLIVGAPQLLGGILPWTIDVISVFSLVCLAAIGLRAPAPRDALPRLGWIMTLCLLWTALQALSLPCSVVSLIAHESADKMRAAALALGHAHASVCSISQDPGATHQEIIKGVAIVCSFMTAWTLAASGGRARVLWLVALSSLAMSAVALLHGVLKLDQVFGLYTPVLVKRDLLLAPLMNPNNLGAFAALGVPLFIGLTYRNPDPNTRLLGYVAVALTATTALLSLSRGAIGQLLASSVFMVWLALSRRNSDQQRAQHVSLQRLGLAAATAFGLGFGVYLAGGQIAHEFDQLQLGKLELIARAFRFALAHSVVGVGRGAFSSAFVAQLGAKTRYAYPEDFIVQWMSEWGTPVALVLLLAIALELWRARKPAMSLARLGALTALLTFCGQNLVDYGFELVGVAVVAAALLACCVAPSINRESSAPAVAALFRPASLIGGLLGFGALALGMLALALPVEQVQALEARLTDAMNSGNRQAFRRELERATSLHPSEPTFALIAATNGIRSRDRTAATWLNRAMQLAPGWAAPHALAFKWLWQHGRIDQALGELRAGTQIDPGIDHEDVCRLALVNPRWVFAAAPHNAGRHEYLELSGQCLNPDNSTEPAFDDELLREFPDSFLALERCAVRLEREHKIEESLALVERMIRTHPEHHRSWPLRFQVLLAGGRLREVIDDTDRALSLVDEDEQAQILATKALALARLGAVDQARETIAQVRQRAATNADRLAESYALEGRIHLELDQPGEAVRAFREAYRINSNTSYLLEVARLAESLGDRPQALWAYINLCQRDPSGGGCAKRNALLGPAGLGNSSE